VKTNRIKMVFTDHAIERALERLEGSKVVNPSKEMCNEMEIILRCLIIPSGATFLDGAKYQARIEGYDSYRAVIKVEDGTHVVTTITPIF